MKVREEKHGTPSSGLQSKLRSMALLILMMVLAVPKSIAIS